ncbi:MAG: hypothetical protein Q4C70_15035, partial [Planctomycetia bacterium]|nr:hypothetical protein [Planctomycetia bacterium]
DYGWQDGNVAVFSLDTEAFPTGKYTLTVSVPNPRKGGVEKESLTLVKYDKMPERKSYIDEHQRMIVDGKPFFPLGLYFHNPSTTDVERMGNSPFNCIMSYAQLSRETLDDLHAHGVSSIYSVKDYYEGLAVKTDEEGRRKTTEKIQQFKDHPAVIAWYINDELPLSMLKVLSEHRDLCEELDPSRPTWVVLYQVDQIRQYIPTFDVIGTDPYPISGKPAALAYEWAKKTRDASLGTRACWQVPQYFNWANYRSSQTQERTPTYDEMRAMTWMSIAGGANGIVGYSYFDMERNYAGRGGSPEAKKESFDRTWNDVCRVGEEVKKYESILLAIDTPAEVTLKTSETSENAKENGKSKRVPDVVYRLYGNGVETWLLAVNTKVEAQTAEFTIPAGYSVKNAEAWDGVSVKVEDTVLTLNFEPLKPVFLKLEKE